MATFWVYLRVQVAMFVFGIVGPIFLGIFFATPHDPTLKWMYWAGLFVTAIDVLVALMLTDQFVRGDRKSKYLNSKDVRE
jgi:hypothetical protein